jgi:hypothetical protein
MFEIGPKARLNCFETLETKKRQVEDLALLSERAICVQNSIPPRCGFAAPGWWGRGRGARSLLVDQAAPFIKNEPGLKLGNPQPPDFRFFECT